MIKYPSLLILLVSTLLLQNLSCQSQQGAASPNVIFILCDDLNDYVEGYYGHPQARTPNIDRLAASGVVFANAHSNAPVCAPSRASLFTGIYPHHSNNFGFDKWFNNPVLKNSKTIMEYLNENGYNVLGTGKLLHHNLKSIWDEFGNNAFYGPHAYNGYEKTGHPSVPEPYRNIGALDGSFAPLSDVPVIEASDNYPGYAGWYNNLEDKPYRYIDENDRDLLPDEENSRWVASKIRELEHGSEKAPFFIAVGFIRPHTPLVAPDKFFRMFPLDSIRLPQIKSDDAEDCFYNHYFTDETSKGLRFYKKMKESFPDFETGLKKYIQAYLACVAFADAQVGIVLDALENSVFNDNTVVIFTSDHGYNHGEKNYLFKNSLWEESTRVPLIIRDPRNRGPKIVVEYPVSLIDIYPTIAEYCGLEGSTRKNSNGVEIDGHSLKPFADYQRSSSWTGPDCALTVITSASDEGELLEHYSIRSKDWRYILYANGEEELYNHVIDPYEWNNIASNHEFETIKSELREKLINLIKEPQVSSQHISRAGTQTAF